MATPTATESPANAPTVSAPATGTESSTVPATQETNTASTTAAHTGTTPATATSEKTPEAAAPATNGVPKSADEPKQEKDAEKANDKKDESKPDDKAKSDDKGKDDQPPGGYDETPIPKRPAGYTVKFTIHRATNLPMGDVNDMSADPYVVAQMNSDTPTRHKEDPHLRFRTKTIRRSTAPEWNEEWIVANVPASGFKLKLHVFDEDQADKDDLLGIVHISVHSLNESWAGFKDKQHKVLARKGSKRAYLLQALTTCFREDKRYHGQIWVSAEILGRTKDDGQNGRLYTAGPCRWVRHYSPILGRLVNMKEPDDSDAEQAAPKTDGKKKEVEKYNFQANQMQLQGPIPADLYHRFVEFKPWVKRMFTGGGISGFLLGKALHHQHTRVYNFGRATEWGHFPQGPCEEMTRKFLDLVHYDQGGRIYTYVLTLDALWRFTETGKEFGIDMLSKHTMHSDVSIYIAFSGEFFIRRLKHANRPPPPDATDETSQVHSPEHKPNESHPPEGEDEITKTDTAGTNGKKGVEADRPTDPQHYQLVIDNDSGTYRPNAKKLPLLKKFLAQALPGLHIMVLDCQADAEKMGKMKDEQREKKKKEGDHIIYTQGSPRSSISSSDEEDLDAIQAGLGVGGGNGEDGHGHGHGHGTLGHATRAAKENQKQRIEKAKKNYGPGHEEREDGGHAEDDPVTETEKKDEVPAAATN